MIIVVTGELFRKGCHAGRLLLLRFARNDRRLLAMTNALLAMTDASLAMTNALLTITDTSLAMTDTSLAMTDTLPATAICLQ